MLLVLYGTLNLWIVKTGNGLGATQFNFCESGLCQTFNFDSPTFIENSPDKPLKQAQSALVLDPASAYRWADLANSEINARNVEGGKFCVRQALASAPGNPAILFRAASFYLRLEDYSEAIRNLDAVLRNPDLERYYGRVFALYSAMDLPLTDLLNQGVPHSSGAANGFLRFWIDQNKLDEATDTWAWIKQNSLVDIKSAGSYSALLLRSGHGEEAMKSWSENTAKLDSSYGVTNWIYNGSFETTPVECPFDWHLQPRESVHVDRDTDAAYKGSTSLRIRFLDTPKDASPEAYQTVILKPGTWQIRAAMRTLGLAGDEGVVIRLVDSEDPSRFDISTATFTHTQEWTTILKTFLVGPHTHVAQVQIVRPQGMDAELHLTGTLWIDAVSLIQLTGSPFSGELSSVRATP